MSLFSPRCGIRFNRLSLVLCQLLCFALFTSFAQVTQSHRFEKTQRNSDEYYTIIPMKSEGIALLQQKDKYKGSKRTWELTFLDTALQERRVVNFDVEMRHHLVGHEYTPGHVYLLYRTGDTNKNDLELFDYSLDGALAGQYEIKPELDFKLTHFVKAENNMIFGGYVSKDPVVLIFDMTTSHIKVVPGFFQKDNELVDLRVNQNQTFNAVITDRSNRSEKKLIFRTYDTSGEMLLEDIVDIDPNKSLQTSITSTLEREELMVLGTYGDRQSRQSVGFFALPVDPFHEQEIHYFDFAQLDHYLDYEKTARAKRIKDRSARDVAAGRNPDFTDYVMPFKVIENKQGFLLLAEVYQPTTNMNPYNSPYNPGFGTYPYPYFYNPYMPYYYYPSRMFRPFNYGGTGRTADEIRTSEAVLLAVDARGNKLWDQSLKIQNTKRATLDQISDFYLKGDSLFFIYRHHDDEIKIKKIDLNTSEAQDTTMKVRLSDPVDEFRSEREEVGVRKWYGNAFYTWGYQTIRNLNNKEDRVRDVFYINKITVQ